MKKHIKKNYKRTNLYLYEKTSNFKMLMGKINFVKFNFIFIVSFILFSIFFACNLSNIVNDYTLSNSTNVNKDIRYNVVKDRVQDPHLLSYKNFYKEQLKQEVDAYINRYSNNSPISVDLLVSVCIKYDMPISFVLAQAQIESHFGTKGVAKRTGSIFNVGTYDNGKILFTYNNPNNSIEPYIKLLKEDYLVDGKTLSDLIETEFVNYNGYRYASNMFYEKHLRTIYHTINKNTNINLLQSELTSIHKTDIKYLTSVNYKLRNFNVSNKFDIFDTN